MFRKLGRGALVVCVAAGVSVAVLAATSVPAFASGIADVCSTTAKDVTTLGSGGLALVAPTTVGGTVGGELATGAAVAGTALSPLVEAVIGVGVFAGTYCGTTYVLNWLFGSHTPETASVATPTTSTSWGGGCWYLNGTFDSNCTTGASGSSTWVDKKDGYSITGFHPNLTVMLNHSPETGNSAVSVTVGWEANNTITSSTGGQVTLSCTASSGTGGIGSGTLVTFTTNVATVATTAGSATVSWPNGQCSGATPFTKEVKVGGFNYGSGSADEEYFFRGVNGAWTTAAPTHVMRYELTCTPTAGGSPVTYTTYSGGFTEAGTLPPISIGACPSGSLMTSYAATEGDAAGAGGTAVLTWTAPTTSPYTAYPLCAPGGASVPCLTQLEKIGPDGLTSPCTSEGVNCSSFDPTQTIVQTSTYTCLWGPYSVPLTGCAAVSTTSTAAPTSTGTPLEGTNPSAGDGTNCMSSGWSWNPVSWVYVPIKCALQWAFVPPDTFLSTETATLTTDWNNSPPGVVVTGLTNVLGSLGSVFTMSAGSCNGPDVNVGPVVAQTTIDSYPFQTCTGPAHDWVAYIRPIMAALVYLTAVFICSNVLAGALGFRLPWQRAEPPEQLALF